MNDCKRIETPYHGHRFRSRLEARWAVFLDAMDARWEYEKEGFVLSNGECYLPDFWLPQLHLWLEIKGEFPDDAERRRCQLLRDESEAAVAIFHGVPGDWMGKLYCWGLSDSSGGSSDWDVCFTNDDDGKLCFWTEERWHHELFSDPLMERPIQINDLQIAARNWDPPTYLHPYVRDYFCRVGVAATRARSARFEHGEEGSR